METGKDETEKGKGPVEEKRVITRKDQWEKGRGRKWGGEETKPKAEVTPGRDRAKVKKQKTPSIDGRGRKKVWDVERWELNQTEAKAVNKG